MADEEKLKHHPGWSRVLLPVGLSGPVGSSVRINSASSLMRERIRKQLKEYRAEALQSIGIAVTRTRSQLSSKSQTNSHAWYRAINKDNEAGFKKYMDQSAKFIRHVAPGSSAEYVDELWDGGHKLKQEIMAKTDHVAASGNSMAVQLRNELKAALDGLIERKVEDFEIGFVEGKDMSPTTQNTVNIINSNISHSALQITKSGKDAISKKDGSKASGFSEF